ncbi:DMT family transporter [Afifella sp. IM 167]|uniref:DMT family transporter n=1 Tax=Afifella sp. IM 167 TaxID=2033586 RepID=UPI001CCB0A26|nr:DMT family transporter [Afifella sp. IM 167]MBZ8134173.1 EamA family transporter [Afifella sp. IM 167]
MSPPAIEPSQNRLGITYMLIAMVAFILNDTLVKVASEHLPTGQIIFVRGLIVSPIVVTLAWWRGGFVNLRILRHRTLVWRTIGEITATSLYLTALFRMPLANASAILQVVPLATTAGAAIFLGEKVGIRRWTAIVIGLTGALLIVRPGFEGFNAWSLLAFLSVGAVAVRDLSSKQLPRGLPTLAVTAVSAVAVGLFGGVMMLFEETVTPSAHDLMILVVAGFCCILGYIFIIAAMRTGEISVVAPFRYSLMVYAVILQIAVFGQWPDAFLLLGTFILVGTGIYTFYRERRVGAREATRSLGAPPPK